MSDLFDKLKKMQERSKKNRTFDELPDMLTSTAGDSVKDFDLEDFTKHGLEGLRQQFRAQGKKVPEMKVVGVAVHVIMVNPDDPKREQMAHSEFVAWHKDCGNPDNFLNEEVREDCKNGNCEDCKNGNCEESEAVKNIMRGMSQDPDEQPYKPNKYDGHMFG